MDLVSSMNSMALRLYGDFQADVGIVERKAGAARKKLKQNIKQGTQQAFQDLKNFTPDSKKFWNTLSPDDKLGLTAIFMANPLIVVPLAIAGLVVGGTAYGVYQLGSLVLSPVKALLSPLSIIVPNISISKPRVSV